MNDKEILKKLAETINNTDCYFTNDQGRDICIFCHCWINSGEVHKPDCPVLLAEQVLIGKPCNICGGFNTVIKNDGHGGTQPCPVCNEGTIEPVKGIEPYSEDHLMCNTCDSTFNKEEKKPQFTKEQAKDIIQCIFGTHFQFVQNDGESYIENLINANYIIDFKPEELIIVHNVLKYKGEYYLKQVATNNCISCALYNKTDCYITSKAYRTLAIANVSDVPDRECGEARTK